MSSAGIFTEEVVADEALVADVRRGDDRAFEQLYERYHRRIGAYVLGMVCDHGRAEDVTQEVFISALRRMRATERPIAFKPWIYEIAKNACIDQFRRSRRTEEVSLEAGQDAGTLDTTALASSGPTPDAAMDAKQQLDDLCGAFGGLSDTHHQILVLRELEGLSYRDIGDRLGMSRPSVESTLFRARKRLSEEYEELVTGERCRAVQQIVGSTGSIGTRDKRRMARHVAHCQPCRRHAHLAGVDTATLTGSVRSAAARVAAFLPLPLPGLLKLRREVEAPLASWAGSAPVMAEPAVSWAKAAVVAATVLFAGGAGFAGHAPGGPAPSVVPPAAGKQAAPAKAAPAEVAPPAARDFPPRTAPGARPVAAAPQPTSRSDRRPAPARNRPKARAEAAPQAPADASPAPIAAPTVPAPSDPSGTGQDLLGTPDATSAPGTAGAPASQPLAAHTPRVGLPAESVAEAQGIVGAVSPQLGQTVGATAAALAG